MKEQAFRSWLSNSYRKANGELLKSGAANSRFANCRNVEGCEGDLDDQFDQDQLRTLLSRLTYSTEDERAGRTARHRIPINGNVREGSAALKAAVSLYKKFRENWIEGTPIVPSISNRSRLPAVSQVDRVTE